MKQRRKKNNIIGTQWAWKLKPSAVGVIVSRGIDCSAGGLEPVYWWKWGEIKLPISRYRLLKYYQRA